ncbi:DUF3443 family protein [Paraburkholderia terrae]|uniref:DUF3443 family protein n=1 Tax=Paraburkholderia terrae TaxID=311230 RepID=UPI001EE2C995|nr:DUF3443 family protein [Paraburkholderia terrae]GJH05704.1 DUF3443 domain-containing protein [Paraburkholderia terrae]
MPTTINTPVTTTSSLATDASAVPTAAGASNTLLVTVSNTATINQPMVSVTICAAGSNATTNCTVVPNVLVDTASFGLRLFASTIPTTLASLPVETDTASGKTITECAIFGSANTYGSVRLADVKLSGKIAQNVPVNILADPSITAAEPSECVVNQTASSPSTLRANGILGIGTSAQDCGSQCENSIVSKSYYATDASTNTSIAVPVAKQVWNPVALFAQDNNGVILEMAQVPGAGTRSTTGTLVFGIDTQANNTPANAGATDLATTQYGDFTASYNGASTVSFMDSGTNVLLFADSSMARLGTGFYAPTATAGHTVTISASNLSGASVGFNIANANTLAASGGYAFNNIGAYQAGLFDLGLPFMFGRHVFYGIQGKSSAGGGAGPYVAYISS